MNFIVNLLLSVMLLVTAPVNHNDTQLSGTASNYRGTAGFIGQATVALPGAYGGRYTGDINGYVTVCATRCATLPVVDYCNCYFTTSSRRIVDLSWSAWALITDLPLSRGLIHVTMTLHVPAPQTISMPDTSTR